jgi:hypothetical protein
MMKRAAIAIAISAALTMPVLADPPAFRDAAFSRPDGVVGIGLTVPFGATRQTEPPRIELRIARDRVNFDGSRQSATDADRMETRIGVSLERDNRLLVNGRVVDTKQRNNVSTAGWIAIGVGVVLVGGVLLVADAARDASE